MSKQPIYTILGNLNQITTFMFTNFIKLTATLDVYCQKEFKIRFAFMDQEFQMRCQLNLLHFQNQFLGLLLLLTLRTFKYQILLDKIVIVQLRTKGRVYFKFDSGAESKVVCYDYEETVRIKNNWMDNLSVAIQYEEIINWLKDDQTKH